jgi:hypothetical protein
MKSSVIFVFYKMKHWDSSVSIVTGCGLMIRVQFLAGAGIFLFATTSTLALGLTQPLVTGR